MAKNKKRKVPAGWTLDLHALYESAVQNVDADVDFLDETYEKVHGHPPALIREDFLRHGSARRGLRSPSA